MFLLGSKMRYEKIINRMAWNEGFDISKEVIARVAIDDIRRGADMVYQYGGVVFTVGVDSGIVHLYSLGTSSLLTATRRFMREVWRIGLTELYAPILDEKLESAAKRFGWGLIGNLPTGHRLYIIRRLS